MRWLVTLQRVSEFKQVIASICYVAWIVCTHESTTSDGMQR